MSPYADCPILEVKPDPGVGLIAVVPPFRGDRETAVVANTLAGLLAFAEGRPGVSVTPQFDPATTADQSDLVMIAASVYHRHQKVRRGRVCPKCGTTT